MEVPRGPLRVMVPADLAQSVLLPVVNEYMNLYLEVTVDLLVSNQNSDLVGEGIDLAIRFNQILP
jgi:DNA-binding transcriptional LysR family regulator